MRLSEYKEKYYRLNNRVKISIKPITEYTYIKGYELSLLYKIKSKLTKNYIWVNVNKIDINDNIRIDSNEFTEKISSLLKRKKETDIKYQKDVILLKRGIKEIYNKK